MTNSFDNKNDYFPYHGASENLFVRKCGNYGKSILLLSNNKNQPIKVQFFSDYLLLVSGGCVIYGLSII